MLFSLSRLEKLPLSSAKSNALKEVPITLIPYLSSFSASFKGNMNVLNMLNTKYFIGGLALLVILTNWWLIPIYKTVGAAIGTCVSIITINSFRLILINIKINHIPFDFNLLKVFFIGIVVFLNSTLIPNIENPFYSILVNGIFITLVFWTLIFVFKISDDINDFAKKQLKKIRRLKNF